LSYSFYPFSTSPAPFDTVWCRFPYVEAPTKPGPKCHPGMIRQAFADQDGNPWVRVVYGTSVDPNRHGNEFFVVSKMSEMNMCGLKCATRFCLDRDVTIPWSTDFFEILPGRNTPIIGHLSQYGQRLLQMQIAYYQQGCQSSEG